MPGGQRFKEFACFSFVLPLPVWISSSTLLQIRPPLKSTQVRLINSGSVAGEVQIYRPSGLEISLWKLCDNTVLLILNTLSS